MPSSRIVELASLIQEHTLKVDSYLTHHQLPTPSFDVSHPLRVPLPTEIQVSQDAVLEATDELTALMLGPAGTIMLKHPFNSWASVQAIERFGIAKAFPPGETATFEEISESCSLSFSDTRRILRHAMSLYIFTEPSPGIVAHTAASKALAEAAIAQYVGFVANEMWPSSSRITDAMKTWQNSEEPNQTGFAVAYGTNSTMLDVVNRDPQRARRMAGAMSFMHSGPQYSLSHLVNNFDWGQAASGLLVDVGGGQGTVPIEILRLVPHLRCIVQDLPDVICSAQVPEDLEGGERRLTFMAHDFFHEQPVKGADIYLLRWILHDWSDKYASRILRNLIPSMRKGSRVLVLELCLPQANQLSPYKERSPRAFDLAMKAIQNAKERDAEDWTSLFRLADLRFKLERIRKPTEAHLSIICATWEGEDMF